MKYEKPIVEVVKFESEGFMTASGAVSDPAVQGSVPTAAEIASSGLGMCYSVTWSGRYTATVGQSWPLIDCRDVVFGSGQRKNDQLYSVPCKTYHT